MLGTDLRAGWSVRAISGDLSERVPGTYQAEVPGCVHTDLMAAGVIPIPTWTGMRLHSDGCMRSTGVMRRFSIPVLCLCSRPLLVNGSIWSSTALTPSPR